MSRMSNLVVRSSGFVHHKYKERSLKPSRAADILAADEYYTSLGDGGSLVRRR